MVPTAYLSGSDELLNQTSHFYNFVLDHQDSTGWIGPEVFDLSKPRYLWGRYPFFFGVMMWSEANPSETDRIVDAMYNFSSLAYTMLQNGSGLEPWTETRWQDYVMALQWYAFARSCLHYGFNGHQVVRVSS
jgi:hypothetical protein